MASLIENNQHAADTLGEGQSGLLKGLLLLLQREFICTLGQKLPFEIVRNYARKQFMPLNPAATFEHSVRQLVC